MLKQRDEANCLEGFHDLVAISAANIFLNHGIKIHGELSLVGFGNVLISEYFRVPLTTIRQPKFRLGVAAMNSMLKLLRGERPEPKRLPAEIVIRASTAGPSTSRRAHLNPADSTENPAL